jgi:hypothetical protein
VEGIVVFEMATLLFEVLAVWLEEEVFAGRQCLI